MNVVIISAATLSSSLVGALVNALGELALPDLVLRVPPGSRSDLLVWAPR